MEKEGRVELNGDSNFIWNGKMGGVSTSEWSLFR